MAATKPLRRLRLRVTSRHDIPVVLTIAGSDSGGGAGIQADLKAFARCGVHGTTAITALTAQNTVGVELIEPVSPAMIGAQIAAVSNDIGIDVVKIGMLGSVETIEAVLAGLERLPEGVPIVLDPVMVSESGSVLLKDDAVAALIERVLPLSTVVTPNVPEAEALTGLKGESPLSLARAIHELGPDAVVVTGGHTTAGIDTLFDGESASEIPGERYADGAAHGSGCTHASALAANLALGYSLLESARRAKQVASLAIRDGLRGIGDGPGPVDVFGIGSANPGTLSQPF